MKLQTQEGQDGMECKLSKIETDSDEERLGNFYCHIIDTTTTTTDTHIC